MWEYNYNYLSHHGIKGQRWGVRRFQNEDGSLTPAGKKRYAVDASIAKNRQTRKVANDYNQMDEKQFKSKYHVSKDKFAKRYNKTNGDTYSFGKKREERAKELMKVMGAKQIPQKKASYETDEIKALRARLKKIEAYDKTDEGKRLREEIRRLSQNGPESEDSDAWRKWEKNTEDGRKYLEATQSYSRKLSEITDGIRRLPSVIYEDPGKEKRLPGAIYEDPGKKKRLPGVIY